MEVEVVRRHKGRVCVCGKRNRYDPRILKEASIKYEKELRKKQKRERQGR